MKHDAMSLRRLLQFRKTSLSGSRRTTTGKLYPVKNLNSSKLFNNKTMSFGGILRGGLYASAIIFLASSTCLALTQAQDETTTTQLHGGVTPEIGVPAEELKQHNTLGTGIWVAINGQVYDLTDFTMKHPGGAQIIEKYAGTDASIIFNAFHGLDFPEKYLPKAKHLGPLIGEIEQAPNILADNSEKRQKYIQNKPDISMIYNASDFEYVARRVMPELAWVYYSAGSEDEMSLRENHNAYSRIFFKPRVLRNVREVDISTTLMGTPVSAPFYCSAAAMAKMGHPEGELSIARGCGRENILQMICNHASYSFSQIFGQIRGQPQWAQVIPLSKDHAINGIKEISNSTLNTIFVTVDVPTIGNRTKDSRFRTSMNKGDQSLKSLKEAGIVDGETAYVTWDDFHHFRGSTDKTLAIKGLQSVEDVIEAAERGVKAVVISNHGGRQLDFSRAPVETLADVMPVLKEKGLDKKIEIYIDGGVRRGSDILKAVALGAKGVGLGRMFLYANATYGEEGVKKLINILKSEMIRDMKMLGVTSLDQLGPEYVDTRNLHARYPPVDTAYYRNYESPAPPIFSNETP